MFSLAEPGCACPWRLPAQELRLAGITEMAEGQPLPQGDQVYLPLHNARFATPAEDRDGRGRAPPSCTPLAGALDDILCVQQERTVRALGHGLSLQVAIPPGHRHHYVKARVRVHEYPDGTLALFHGPRCLARYNADGEPIDSQTRQAA